MTRTNRSPITLNMVEPRQLVRLDLFRRQHPAAGIYRGDGFWQAVIPPGVIPADGSTHVITRHALPDLLDEIDTRLNNGTGARARRPG